MVSNSTKINKTNNHLSLNTKKKTTTYDAENPRQAWNRHKYAAELNQLWYSNPTLDNLISNGNTYESF
jgi:hypothetical protein